jgi:hypothetical protein
MTTNINKTPATNSFLAYLQTLSPYDASHKPMQKHHLNPFSSYSPPIPGLPQLGVMIDPINAHATRLAKGSAENALAYSFV